VGLTNGFRTERGRTFDTFGNVDFSYPTWLFFLVPCRFRVDGDSVRPDTAENNTSKHIYE
jgi:hypothetical protein